MSRSVDISCAFFLFFVFIQSNSGAVSTSSRQMPVGYFRTFTLQPFFTYPPSSSAYPNFYNPLTNWPNEYLPSPPMPTPNFYASPSPLSSTHKPASMAPSSTSSQPSLLNFQTIFKSLSASASHLLPASVPVRSTTTSTTTTSQPTSTTTAATTTTTTTTTTESPTTSTLSDSIIDHTDPLNLNRLDGDSRHSEISSQSNRVPLINRRSDVSPSSWNRQSYQQPISDALIQQYFSNFLAASHMHVVPCMCPMSLGMPPMTSLSDYLAPSSRSDDIADDEIDGVIDDQSIVNKLIE